MASTYVNDLRLNELGTGDGSGTWGTTTNTNLELIGEAFGFGTEAITTNANTIQAPWLMVLQTKLELCILSIQVL